jgi:type I restriction-modification system DNA methylase subunit
MFSLGVFERKVLNLHYKQLNMAKKKDNTTSIGFEDAIWRAADKLRGNLNASEYEGYLKNLVQSS